MFVLVRVIRGSIFTNDQGAPRNDPKPHENLNQPRLPLQPASCSLALLTAVVVFYLCDIGKRDFDDLAVCTLDLDARRGEGLSGFHAANDAAYAPAVACDNLDVVFAI
jgi:hypothetical protein